MQNIPEDFVRQREMIKANIDVLRTEIDILYSTRRTCFPPLPYLQLIVHGSYCRPRKQEPFVTSWRLRHPAQAIEEPEGVSVEVTSGDTANLAFGIRS